MAMRSEIYNIKKIINCILENGAYSNKNSKIQIAKGSSSYNPAEKILVKTAWKFRKLQGKIMQSELKKYLDRKKDFLAYLKNEDEDLYNELRELII